MYPIHPDSFDLFTHPHRQVVEITVHGQDETLYLTEKDVVEGGLIIDRYCSSGNHIGVGNVTAGELHLELDNSAGQFQDVRFEGAELFIRIGVADWDLYTEENAEYHFVPMGYFTVDVAPRKLETITLTALDRMVRFDKRVGEDEIFYPSSIWSLITRICSVCNVPLKTVPNTLPNYDYQIGEPQEAGELTYRQYLSWIAEITGTNCYIDWDGQLVFDWYQDTGFVLEDSLRYTSDLYENEITITGVQIADGDTAYLAGTDEYAINIEANMFVRYDHALVLTNMSGNLIGFSYTPFSATVESMPHLWPMDVIHYKDSEGTEHPVAISHVTFQMNSKVALQGVGESATQEGWALANPFTHRETVIIRSIMDDYNETINRRVQDVLAFNDLISNALGMYSTNVPMPDGSMIVYMHDSRYLEDSMYIFTMTSEGIAWTTSGWNDGSPSWSSGTTAAGDALFRFISAQGLNLSSPGDDYSVEITPSTFKIYYKNMQVMSIQEDEMRIPKIVSSEYIGVGRIKIVPVIRNGEMIGTDIVFLNDPAGLDPD